MLYIVSLDYKRFQFDTLAAAGEFAFAAKAHSVHENTEVKITIEQDVEAEDQED